MKHHHKQALYAGGFTALVFISMILYPKNVKAAELLILEGIKTKVPETIQLKIEETVTSEATKIIVKEVFPFSTILSSKVRNFLSNRFHLTVNHLGTILKDRVSPENLLTQPQGRPIREIVDNNFIIKLIAFTGTSLFNIKEKLFFFNKETTSVKENVPIVRNHFTLGVFFMWFISQILSPEQLASLSLEELLYLQEIYESNGEKDSRLLSDYEESVEIVAYHNILQEFLQLGNKIVDFPKKHPLFSGIFMTSLMSLLIIRERPQLM